jgi:hypothetical protein
MKQMNGSKQHVDPVRPPKTSADFLHWLQTKNALEKQATAQVARANEADSRALMVWADDGGRLD